MTIAGFVNLAMMATLRRRSTFLVILVLPILMRLTDAATAVKPCCGNGLWIKPGAAGLSSTVVGTLAGQVVMQGSFAFISRCGCVVQSPCCRHYRHSDGIRSDTDSGYESGAVSFGIALALVPLLIFTSDSKLWAIW